MRVLGSHSTSGNSLSRVFKRFTDGIAGALNLKSSEETKQTEALSGKENIRGLTEGYRMVEVGAGSQKIFISEPTEKVYFEDDEEYAPTIRPLKSDMGEGANLPASQRKSVRFEEPADLFVNARKRPVYETVDYDQFTIKKRAEPAVGQTAEPESFTMEVAEEAAPTFETVEIEAGAPVVSIEDVEASEEVPVVEAMPEAEPVVESVQEIPVVEAVTEEIPVIEAAPDVEIVQDIPLIEAAPVVDETAAEPAAEEPVFDIAAMADVPEAEFVPAAAEESAVLEAEIPDMDAEVEAEELRESEVDVAIKHDAVFVQESPLMLSAPEEVPAVAAPEVDGLYAEGESEVSDSSSFTDDIVGIGGNLLGPQMALTSGTGAEELRVFHDDGAEIVDTTEPEPCYEIRNENRDYLMAFVPGLVDEEVELSTSEDLSFALPDDGLESYDEKFTFRTIEPSVETVEETIVPEAEIEEAGEKPSALSPAGIDTSAVAAVIDGLFDD